MTTGRSRHRRTGAHGLALRTALLAGALAVAAPAARATWSIIIIDTETKEIGIASATCLLNFDLRRGLPVLRVGVGAAAAQATVDSQGTNRMRIWSGLINGLSPETILMQLQNSDALHQRRQYGIVDARGRAITFTGSLTIEYSDGVIGAFENYVYAIQGNILTGAPVIEACEAALLSTPGGIPERIMAAMEAARSMGGDGRCSCTPQNPMGCGSPPEQFTKSAHIGFFIVSRRGDVNGQCNANVGCASGQYWMNFNYVTNDPNAPDPVFVMQDWLDTFRQNTIGVPDQVESLVSITPPVIPNDGASVATLHIEVRDWTGAPAQGIEQVAVEHDADSAGSASIGPVQDLGDSKYEVQLTAGQVGWCDKFAITVKAGTFQRVLMQPAHLWVYDTRADLNGDGQIDQADLGVLIAAYGLNGDGDLDGDGDTDQGDLGLWLALHHQRFH
ncbi:MAG TPA: DUF1028 domain-containing protein [Phycisphaerae bacterium]|nr:DUF1028 domain-containing protein [Phycisphaerae bacterium]